MRAESLKATQKSLKDYSSCSNNSRCHQTQQNMDTSLLEHQSPINESTNLCIQNKDKRGWLSGFENAYQLQPKYAGVLLLSVSCKEHRETDGSICI